MQPLKKLSGILGSLADKDHFLFTAADLSGIMGDGKHLAVVLSRAVKAGLLKRVCRGVYLYPPAAGSLEHVLFHAAARLRPDELNYISLETALSDAGLISQVPMNWITLMSSGRSHVVNCGEFGRMEFVHTAQSPADLSDDLTYDADRHLWRASVSQALRDMKATRRSMDLVNLEAAHESV
ncbi:MAG: type IV toxin-antitoxin system AbiEi family antitoxin domain-containing protein [Chthoniobacterales bacterium]